MLSMASTTTPSNPASELLPLSVDVSLTIRGHVETRRDDPATMLAGDGFNVVVSATAPYIPAAVVLHGSEGHLAAMTVARYLDPAPHVVADGTVDGVEVVIGADYGGVLFVFQKPMVRIREQVRARGFPSVLPGPDPGSAPT